MLYPTGHPSHGGEKTTPRGFLVCGLSKKRCSVSGRLLFISLLSPCCLLPPCCALPTVPVCAGPRSAQLGRAAGVARQPPHQLCPHTGGPLEAVSISAREVTCLPVCQSRVACCSYSCAKDVGLHPITPLAPPVEDEPVWEMFVRWQMLSPPPQHGGRSWQHRGGILQVGSCTSRGAKKKLHLEREKSGGVVVRKRLHSLALRNTDILIHYSSQISEKCKQYFILHL